MKRYLLILMIVVLSSLATIRQTYLAKESALYSDEATTIIAARGIVETGLPRVPSKLIYYRSPLSHYAVALSIHIFGDDELGWRGASIVAYGLLLLIVGVMLVNSGFLWVGLASTIFISFNSALQSVGSSARMYMVYTLFSTIAVMYLVFSRSSEKRWSPLYLTLCVIPTFCHQHFLVFIPGLLLAGLYIWWRDNKPFPFWTSTLALGPLIAAGICIILHFSENYLPQAFTNFSSAPTTVMANSQLQFPAETLLVSFPAASIFIIFFGIRCILSFRHAFALTREQSALMLVFLPAFISTCILLPARLSHYLAPLSPLLQVLLLLSFAMPTKQSPSPKILTWTPAFLGILFAGIMAFYFSLRALEMEIPFLPPTESPNREQKNSRWERVADWVKVNNAIVASTDPEISLLKLHTVSNEVRYFGVPAQSECESVKDDFIGQDFIHSECILKALISSRNDRPILIMGSRFFAFEGVLYPFIRENFKFYGTLEGQKLFCYGDPCSDIPIWSGGVP